MKRYLSLAVLALGLTSAGRAQQQPAPELSISANDSQNINLYAGWPLIVHTTIMNSLRLNSGSSASPLVIAPTGTPWTSAMQLTAVSSSGQKFQWPLQLVGTPDSNALTLPPTSYVRVIWQMSPNDVAALPADTYQLTATLQVANSNGWNGMVHSRAATIVVGPEPTLTADDQSRKTLLIAEYDANTGDLNDAVTAAQQNLSALPNDSGALSAMANLLELQGQPEFAFMAANNSVAAYYQANPTPIEAPFNLWMMYGRLLDEFTSDGSGPTPTTLVASSETATFSPASQTVSLSAMVSGTSGQVGGGTVTFIVTGAGNPVTSQPVVNGAASAVLTIPGGTAAGSYSIQAVYTGTTAFSPSTDTSQTLTISKATSAILWSDPGPIASGTPLGASQLNATASVPGTFVYNPPAGTILASGTTQTLSVTFTPADATDYNSAMASVSVTILGGTYSGSVSPTSATIPVGSSQTFNITVNSSTFDGAVSLACANPPSGITCQFQPAQLNLSPNASSSTMIKVTVSAKPATLVVPPPAGRISKLPSPRLIVVLLTMAILVVVLCLTVRNLQHAELGQRRLELGRLLLAILLFASFHMAACVSASLTGQGPAKNGGGGGAAPANVILTIQGTSGANAVNITTLPITVP
ncbi:MAG TPA: Ig-like domain-containing protein [Gemmata sp.]|jgi:hypothetical protein|nr:Ig-like domain-containing protein [Gemmata sp.]